jgi:hypothetical protein
MKQEATGQERWTDLLAEKQSAYNIHLQQATSSVNLKHKHLLDLELKTQPLLLFISLSYAIRNSQIHSKTKEKKTR